MVLCSCGTTSVQVFQHTLQRVWMEREWVVKMSCLNLLGPGLPGLESVHMSSQPSWTFWAAVVHSGLRYSFGRMFLSVSLSRTGLFANWWPSHKNGLRRKLNATFMSLKAKVVSHRNLNALRRTFTNWVTGSWWKITLSSSCTWHWNWYGLAMGAGAGWVAAPHGWDTHQGMVTAENDCACACPHVFGDTSAVPSPFKVLQLLPGRVFASVFQFDSVFSGTWFMSCALWFMICVAGRESRIRHLAIVQTEMTHSVPRRTQER